MTLTTPNESYNPDNGSRLLVSAGESFVKVAMSDLLDRGVVSKVVRDPKKSKPGRLLKISEVSVKQFQVSNVTFNQIPSEIKMHLVARYRGISFKTLQPLRNFFIKTIASRCANGRSQLQTVIPLRLSSSYPRIKYVVWMMLSLRN